LVKVDFFFTFALQGSHLHSFLWIFLTIHCVTAFQRNNIEFIYPLRLYSSKPGFIENYPDTSLF